MEGWQCKETAGTATVAEIIPRQPPDPLNGNVTTRYICAKCPFLPGLFVKELVSQFRAVMLLVRHFRQEHDVTPPVW
jgi:hypothetical protein